MPPLSFHDQRHLTRMFMQEQRVNAIFNAFIRRISPELRRFKEHKFNNVWVRNSAVESVIDRELINLKFTLENEIKTNQKNAWNDAGLKNDKLVENYIKGMSLSSVAKEGMFSRNLDALTALQNRIDNGLSLSDRIWSITKQTKGNVELYLESGLATGRNAEQIGRDMRDLLKQPDKRFRRIRDKNGKLVASQPMKEYNPGRGVYRSSRMNALRVSATETNMGYRVSDSERWKQLDFILGFEVKRSPNAKPCKVCDALAGKYPKDFVFPGWHPFCICFGVPIVMGHDDFADYLLLDKISVEKYIQDIPKNARDFIERNPTYIDNSYLGVLNKSFFNGGRGNIKTIARKLRQSQKPAQKRAFVAFEPFSPVIVSYLSKLKSGRERQKLLKSVLDDENFKLLLKNQETGAKTMLHPLHKGASSNRWAETKQMAADLNTRGIDVGFLPEYDNESSADAITMFKGRYVIADFKYSSSRKGHSLYKDLKKGFRQSQIIVLKLDKGDLSTLQNAIEEMSRKGESIGDLKIINKYGKFRDVESKDLKNKKYLNSLRGFL